MNRPLTHAEINRALYRSRMPMCHSVRAMSFGPALPMNRARILGLGLSVGIAIAVAGCRPALPEPTVPKSNTSVVAYTVDGTTQKFCDEGRAVYVLDGSYSGGIAIVENARECGK